MTAPFSRPEVPTTAPGRHGHASSCIRVVASCLTLAAVLSSGLAACSADEPVAGPVEEPDASGRGQDGLLNGEDAAIDGANDVTATDPPDASTTCVPAVEACNALDDDCDGATDEGLCDDGSACTQDACVVGGLPGACTATATEGPCDDLDPCTKSDVCKGGACKGISTCDDNIECTADLCDATGGCSHFPGTSPCDDGSACTSDDACKDGACAGGPPLTCDDGIVCTKDGCDPLVGCQHAPSPSVCDDGDACTEGDACADGVCKGGSAKACSDSDPCTVDACDPKGGGCKFTAQAGACDDGNPCTAGDTCATGATGKASCSGKAIDCADDNPCTSDGCDVAVGGCTHLKLPPDTVCKANDACMGLGLCDHTGTCVATAKVCDDGNPCTVDKCQKTDGACFFEKASGAPCTDGSPCTVGDACATGACVPGPAKVCNDANPCTDDFCTQPGGACLFTSNVVPCSDGNACTSGDACADKACKPGAAKACDDGNLCTKDACDATTGSCVAPAVQDGVACQDGKACTQGDACKAGKCVPGPVPPCADGNACTTDACDPKTGKCAFMPAAGTGCDDSNPCTSGDTCLATGKCAPGTDICACKSNADCVQDEDGDACNGTLFCDLDSHTCKLDLKTIVTCDTSKNTICVSWACDKPTGKCKPSNNPDSIPCDADSSVCTQGDKCVAGICQPGTLPVCNDGNPCTNDLCDPVKGCTAVFNTVPCQDGNDCTYDDHCKQGKCASGPVKPCNDGNVCTFDFCDSALGSCSISMLNGNACDDGNPCTVGDSCGNFGCLAGKETTCDDDSACTTDKCDLATGSCAFTPYATGTPCDDASPCTLADVCKLGKCTSGPPPSCNDGNPCTTDSCDTGTGKCVNAANTSGCTDGNACTLGDGCKGGACVPGNPKLCASNQACTVASCEVATGKCVAKADALPCNDGNACSDGDACKNGVCAPGTWVVCNDGNACTNDSCNTASGKCVFAANNFQCVDGNACTVADSCKAGVCVGVAKSCSDGNACTTDSCDPTTGCKHQALDAIKCEDGSVCTTGDTCKVGKCIGAGIVCGDGNPCTSDSCHAVLGCQYAPWSGGCFDGNYCTLNDQCTQGKCLPGPPQTCNDGLDCTDDACKPGDGLCYFTADDSNVCSDGDFCSAGESCSGGKCLNGPNNVGCNDDNACTADLCIPAKGCIYIQTAAVACDDGDKCTVKDVCIGGKCLSGTNSPCDDDNSCTSDLCDPGQGCVYTNNDLKCSDGDACLGPDLCSGGKCSGAAKVVCDDSNTCTADSCDSKVGCVHSPNGTASCDDGNECTATSNCKNGICSGKSGANCDDGDPCTTDLCSATKGCSTKPAPDGTGCDDANPCTTFDTCKVGKCQNDSSLSCDDGNACTVDTCDSKKGCLHAAGSSGKSQSLVVVSGVKTTVAGAPAVATWDKHPQWTHAIPGATWIWSTAKVEKPDQVSQVTFNTVLDVPAGEVLVGELQLAADGAFVCTLNGFLVGVEIAENSYANSLVLNLTGKLKAGPNSLTCIVTNPGKPGSTAETNPAGLLFRAQVTSFEKGGALPCQDANACTAGDWCQGDVCKAGAPASCDDDNGCTADSCDPTAGCGHAPNAATLCDDANVCTVQDGCSKGVCAGKTATTCTDYNPCTLDSCDPKKGCQFAANDGKACDDGDACTAKDACLSGKCVAATGTACDDGNPCTQDGCSGQSGCFHTATADGKCDDGNGCTAGDTCTGGNCVGQAAANCDDGDPCTQDACDAVKNCVHIALASGNCDDSNACTAGDSCVLPKAGNPSGGGCTGGALKACSDGEPCTTDSCDPKTGACSFVGGSGNKCEDGNLCTINDLCKDGKCGAGPLRVCGDGDACTIDSCDVATGDCLAVQAVGGYACDDGDGCTTADVCMNGKCIGKAKACDDANACTIDGCDAQSAKCTFATATDGTACGSGGACKSGTCSKP